jgi:hypothetical protein
MMASQQRSVIANPLTRMSRSHAHSAAPLWCGKLACNQDGLCAADDAGEMTDMISKSAVLLYQNCLAYRASARKPVDRILRHSRSQQSKRPGKNPEPSRSRRLKRELRNPFRRQSKSAVADFDHFKRLWRRFSCA